MAEKIMRKCEGCGTEVPDEDTYEEDGVQYDLCPDCAPERDSL